MSNLDLVKLRQIAEPHGLSVERAITSGCVRVLDGEALLRRADGAGCWTVRQARRYLERLPVGGCCGVV